MSRVHQQRPLRVRQSTVLAKYERIAARLATNPETDLVTMRAIFDELSSLAGEPEGVRYAEVVTDHGRDLWCIPENADTGVILHFPGGGLVGNSPRGRGSLLGISPRARRPAHLNRTIAGHPSIRSRRSSMTHPGIRATAYRGLHASADRLRVRHP